MRATTTVTGHVADLGGTAATSNTFVRFTLRGCAGGTPRVLGTALIAPTQGAVWYKDFAADASGNVSGTIYSTRDNTGNGNGDIDCNGSRLAVWYGMSIWQGGKSGPEIPVHAKSSSTLDVTQVTPITTNPVVTSPTGDSTYLRLDAGNSPVTGNLVTTGTLCTQQVNGVLVVGCGANTTVQITLNNVTTPGSEVFAPCGTYNLASGLNFPSFPVNFTGADKNCAILNFSIASGIGMSPWYGSRVTHFTIQGLKTGSALGLNGGAAAWVTLTGYTTANNNISPTFANANGHIYKETVASCTSGASEPTWPTIPAGTVNDANCTWQESGLMAVEVYDNIFDGWANQQLNTGGNNYGWKIHDNVFRNSGTESILIGQNSQKMNVYSNQFDSLGSNAVDVNGSYNIVQHNIITRCGLNGGGGGIDHDAIVVFSNSTSNTDYNIIQGNSITSCTESAIIVKASPGSHANYGVIADNVISLTSGTANNGDGINIDGTSGGTETGWTIANNVVQANQRYGITVGVGPAFTITNTTITGNTVIGNGTGGTFSGIHLDGGGTGTLNDTTIAFNTALSNSAANQIDYANAGIARVNDVCNKTDITNNPGCILSGPTNSYKFLYVDGYSGTRGSNATALWGDNVTSTLFHIQPPGGKLFNFDGSNGNFQSSNVIANQGTACTNGELALSAGWQSTGSATVTAVAGNGQTCSWTITTGTTTAANPTITDTLTNALPAATTVCWMSINGGTHTAIAGESLRQTTLSATAPIFTANFTPTAGGTTYFVTRGCGP
jgi:hypothetical protein